VDLPQFTVHEVALSDPLRIDQEGTDSFTLYGCVSGSATVRTVPDGGAREEVFPIGAGEALLVPAETREFYLVPTARDTVLLEVVLSPRREEDPYLSAAPRQLHSFD